ncbi:MAG: hypothetical protein FJ317_02435, partial [SAR202 cluster bacterium]|nr:hypothetical protein [SAR202 cluster bacterium]
MSATAVMIALRLAGPGVALALSAVSLIRSDAWRLWVDLLTRALQSDLLDFWFFTWTFRVLSSPWLLILPAFLLLGLASLGTRSGRWHNTIFIACFFAQFPGLLSHTTFQWLRLISSDLVITPQPGIVPVAAALLS